MKHMTTGPTIETIRALIQQVDSEKNHLGLRASHVGAERQCRQIILKTNAILGNMEKQLRNGAGGKVKDRRMLYRSAESLLQSLKTALT